MPQMRAVEDTFFQKFYARVPEINPINGLYSKPGLQMVGDTYSVLESFFVENEYGQPMGHNPYTNEYTEGAEARYQQQFLLVTLFVPSARAESTLARQMGGGLSGTLKQEIKGSLSQVQVNRANGNAYRDELAVLLRQAGRDVNTEVYKKTPFGKRFIDIEVSQNETVLGGIETKVGKSRYTPIQQLKDWWLKNVEGYTVNVSRKP